MVFLIVWLALVIPTPAIFSDTEVPELELDVYCRRCQIQRFFVKDGQR